MMIWDHTWNNTLVNAWEKCTHILYIIHSGMNMGHKAEGNLHEWGGRIPGMAMGASGGNLGHEI